MINVRSGDGDQPIAAYSPIMRVGLVACVKAKRAVRSPAGELYNSSLFRKASAYCAATYDRWAILSAKYGLIWPDTLIDPYDLTLKTYTANQRRVWAQGVVAQLQAWEAATGVQPVYYFHAGKNYREYLLPAFAGRAVEPLAHLGIGQMLAWYKERGY